MDVAIDLARLAGRDHHHPDVQRVLGNAARVDARIRLTCPSCRVTLTEAVVEDRDGALEVTVPLGSDAQKRHEWSRPQHDYGVREYQPGQDHERRAKIGFSCGRCSAKPQATPSTLARLFVGAYVGGLAKVSLP